MWQLDGGESRTETYELRPPGGGDLSLALVDQDSNILEEWHLTVSMPQAALGETISYYDGLELTIDAQLRDSVTVPIEDYGEYAVGVVDAPWVEVAITAENTSMDQKVDTPWRDSFAVLAGGTQLERSDGGYLGSDSEYEVLDADREFKDYEGFSLEDLENHWDPPSELVPDASEQGVLLFKGLEGTTVDELSISVNRNETRATWE